MTFRLIVSNPDSNDFLIEQSYDAEGPAEDAAHDYLTAPGREEFVVTVLRPVAEFRQVKRVERTGINVHAGAFVGEGK